MRDGQDHRDNTVNTDTLILRTENVAKQVATPEGSLTLLEDVNLSVAAGMSLAIVGRSGAGKSTLLGILAGLDLPTTGEVYIDGTALSQLSEDERAALRAHQVGFVFQSFQLLPALSALENISLPLALKGEKNADEKAREWLEKVGLGHRIGHTPRQLSGGEQQRVALARAFSSEPSLLFADEPTGNLDEATGEHIMSLLFSLNASSATTLVMVTHDEGLAARCDQRVIMEAGRVL
ncbi:ABC transporter ATP-binding protein [Pokkaliibacter sp. CJK22405]|uniref:ABC transporter ATP-binding protein n=1 Tax=Pokkaliibacter sp. CJK22405 TaxID=3384615 RepID=UPI0039854400